MDAVKFIKELRRMCTTHTGCESCPAERCECQSLENMAEDTRIVAIVEEWSAAHPRKTLQSVFLEQWPDAEIGCQGTIAIYPCYLDKTLRKKDCNSDCEKCRQEYWTKAV